MPERVTASFISFDSSGVRRIEIPGARALSLGVVGHPKAKRAYAWAHLNGPKDNKTRFVAVLEMPPVKDAQSAVKVSIVADSKKAQS